MAGGLVALAAGLAAFAQPAAVSAARSAEANARSSKPLPLVPFDEDFVTYLDAARDSIEANDPLHAIEILQKLVDLTETKLIADADGRRFLSLGHKAAEVIGGMGPEGLKAYRAMYGPQAQKLYEDSLAAGDTVLLRKIPYRYLHTVYGAKALDMLGAVAFDTGRFLQAGRYWRQVLQLHSTDLSEPLLLAKLGAAQHLAGEPAKAEETAAVLKEKYPQAHAAVGGRDRNLVEFLEEVLRLPPMPQAVGVRKGEGWPGWGADNTGLMCDVDVVLAPRWYHPIQASRTQLKLVALNDVFRANPSIGRLNVSLKEGHVEAQGQPNPNGGYYGGDASVLSRKQVLPPVVQPVVSGDWVLYRSDDAVVACDLVTGEMKWDTKGLPMERANKTPNVNRGYYYNPYGWQPEDTGRHTLTVAEGMVFAVANFKAPGNPYNNPFGPGNPNAAKDMDSSELVAISLSAQGKQVWSVGFDPSARDGVGTKARDEVVAGARYLSAPTYEAGRLFVMAAYVENYYLLCLEAATGELVWKTLICQVPVQSNAYMGGYAQLPVHKGSPLAVADGRVFAITNAGVVAALDCDTGQMIWAYQYDSPLNQVISRVRRSPSNLRDSFSPSPVIVAAGKVVCLPCDSEKVLALSTEDGTPAWEADRAGQHDLSAVDAGRVLLSGPQLILLSLADGSREWESQGQGGVIGRPAVTPTSIYASGRGRLLRVNLADLKVSDQGLTGLEDTLGLLGNLVSVKDELIAANTLGICAYMNYEHAWSRLTERIDAADANVRPDLVLSRGRFAFNARRFPEALNDLTAASELAKQQSDRSDLVARVRPLLHRTYIGLGNAADANVAETALSTALQDANLADAMFRKALELADTAQEEGHMRLRLAKHFRALATVYEAEAARKGQAGDAPAAAALKQKGTGQLTQAIALAQELLEDFSDEELADVQIGKDADDSALVDGRADFLPARKLARELIQGILRKHGRQPYASLDAAAQAALLEARRKGDSNAMIQVARKWPDSLWADNATLLAAEMLYRQVTEEKGDGADATSAQAMQLLAPLAAESSDRQVRITANAAMAALYAHSGRLGSAEYSAQRARELAAESGADVAVAFADLHGKLEDVLKQISGEKHTPSLRPLQYICNIQLPISAAFAFKDDSAYIIRDQEGRPLRLGERILVLQGNRAVMVSTAASDANIAVDWQALTSVDPEDARRYAHLPVAMRLVAGLSRDEKVLGICDRTSLRGFDVRTAKAVWSKTMAQIGVPGGPAAMAVGEGVAVVVDASGRVACVELATGNVLWNDVNLVGQAKMPSAPPQIVGGKVLIRHEYGRKTTCLDVGDHGRVLGKWDGGTSVDAAFAPNGNLAVLADGTLSLYDGAQIGGKPLWTRRYDRNRQPVLLAVDNDYVAVAPSNLTPLVEVMAMTGGDQPALSVSLPDQSNQRVYPVDATFEGPNLFVTASAQPVNMRQNMQQRFYLRGLSLHRIDLDRKRRAWSYEVEAPGPGPTLLMTSPVVGRNHVAMAARNVQGGESAVHIIDMQTGKRAGKIDLMGRVQALDAAQQRRLQMIGPPAMTNGRLVVETLEGVVVYGGQ